MSSMDPSLQSQYDIYLFINTYNDTQLGLKSFAL